MIQEEYLIGECKKINIELSDLQVKQFMDYYHILVEWNKFMNLTGITEFEEVVMKHFVDSLSIAKVVDFSNGTPYIMDMGTGAGFPGIPLKIVYPNVKFVLADSLNKRIKFLNEVITQLGLKDIIAIHGRAETLGKSVEYREKFDYVVSRAVANMSVLAEYCMPFVKVGGAFLPYKSGAVEEELQQSKHALSILGGKATECKYFCLPDTEIQRAIIRVDKKKSTPKAYPRNDGKPTKEPLQ